MHGTVSESILTRKLLVKDVRSDTRLYSLDASSLFSMKHGAVGFQLSLPSMVRKGVYARCNKKSFFPDFLLFSVNPSRYHFISPGIYAAFTPEGIELGIWTSSGKYSIFDTLSSSDPGEMHVYEFCWDRSAKLLGGGARAAIFIDGECTASSNMAIAADSIEGIEFTALDTEWMDFQTECTISDLVTYDTVPLHLRNRIQKPSSRYFGTGYVAVGTRSKTLLWTESWNDHVVESSGGPLLDSRFSMSACDTSGDLYVVTGRGVSGYGTVTMASQYNSSISVGLSAPSCVAVSQLDGVSNPKIYSDGIRRCPYVWVADGPDVILFDHFLSEMARNTGFLSISCIIPISDGRVWTLDKGAGMMHLLAEGTAETVLSIPVSSPDCGGVLADGKLYVYDSLNMAVRLYDGAAWSRSRVLPRHPVRIDVDPVARLIFAFFSDGVVQRFDWNLNGMVEWSVSPGCVCGAVRRGINRRTVVIVDQFSRFLYEVDYNGVVVRKTLLPVEMFSGGIAVPAANDDEFALTAKVSASMKAGVSMVVDLRTDQFNVDRLQVDLSGGGQNDRDDVRSSGIVPLDLPFGIIKGTRLPE